MKSELILDLISQKILLVEINTVRKKQTFDLENKKKSECDDVEQNKTIAEIHEDKKAKLEVLKK